MQENVCAQVTYDSNCDVVNEVHSLLAFILPASGNKTEPFTVVKSTPLANTVDVEFFRFMPNQQVLETESIFMLIYTCRQCFQSYYHQNK